MDIPDDPSNTTTTTDYESGDSEGVDYVYAGQKIVEVRKPLKGPSPRRRPSPRAHHRTTSPCVCGSHRPEDHVESIASGEDTDTGEEGPGPGHHSRPGKPRNCDLRAHRKTNRKLHEHKTLHLQAPYIEEYPDDAPRPAILLREHKLLRRCSTSDARRLRGSEDRSLSAQRGRSPGKHLPPRPPRLASKGSHKHPKPRKRRPDFSPSHQGTLFFFLVHLLGCIVTR